MAVLSRLQRGLEQLYRIDTQVAVDDYLIDAAAREQFEVARSPREQLLLSERDGVLEIGLFVDQAALANLRRDDPTQRLHDGNLGDFLLAIEGVSHFVYLIWKARAECQVSALELELQAEVDKYVTCLLACEGAEWHSTPLRHRLFRDCEFEADLDEGERDRYARANDHAERYSASLERRFVRPRRMVEMLAELRQFYRLPLAGKVDLIRAAGAG
jgi:hypothetical protein